MQIEQCDEYLEPDGWEGLVLNTDKLRACWNNRLKRNPTIARVQVRYKNGVGSYALIGQVETGDADLAEEELDTQREDVIELLKQLITWHLQSNDLVTARYKFDTFSPGQQDRGQVTLDARVGPNVASPQPTAATEAEQLNRQERIEATHCYAGAVNLQRDELESQRSYSRALEARLIGMMDQPTALLQVQQEREAVLSKQLTASYAQLTGLYAQQFNVELAAQQHETEQRYADERHQRHMKWLTDVTPSLFAAVGPGLRAAARRIPMLRRFVGDEGVAKPAERAVTLSVIALSAIRELDKNRAAVEGVLSAEQLAQLRAFSDVARRGDGVEVARAFSRLREQIEAPQLLQLLAAAPGARQAVSVLAAYADRVAKGDQDAIEEIRTADRQ